MSRGQQGIGISAAGMYAQLTTGKPVLIISRTGAHTPAHYFEVQIDTKKNEPRIFENKKIDWENHRGTQVTLEIEGRYQKGRASVDEYLEQTAIANPHVKLVYHTPEGETKVYPRTIQELPSMTKPRNIHGAAAEALYNAIQSTKIMAPPSNCISPIGEKAILHGLYKQIKGSFYTAVTRPPAVYRGNPFVIEAGLAFGKGPEETPDKPG